MKSGSLCAQLPEQLPLATTEVNGSNPAIKYLYIKYIWRLLTVSSNVGKI